MHQTINKLIQPPTNSANHPIISAIQPSSTIINHPTICAIHPQEDGCLLLPKPVTLHESGWTLSCWILAPFDRGARASAAGGARHLLDGAGAEERVMLALVRGKLRNIAEGRDGGAPEGEDTEDTPKIEGSLMVRN